MLELIEKQAQLARELLGTLDAQNFASYSDIMTPEEQQAHEKEMLKEKNRLMMKFWEERRKLKAKMRKEEVDIDFLNFQILICLFQQINGPIDAKKLKSEEVF